jgi:hypothetical protein
MIAAMPLPGLSGQNLMRWMLFSVLAMGMLSLSAGRGTLAYFTTQVQSNNNNFTAGNLRFNILDSVTTTGQYPSIGSSISVNNMKPGQSVYAPIQLNNVGNIAAKFGIKYTTTTAYAATANGGTVGGTTTTLTDSGHSAAVNTAFPASLVNDYVVFTGGTGANQYSLISATTAGQLTFGTVTTAPAADTTYSVAKWASKAGSGSTTTSLVDTGATPTWGNLVNYSVTMLTGGDAGQTTKITAQGTNTLTLSPALTAAPAANDVYYVTPSNLAPALQLGIVGKGAGTAAASPPTTSGANACNAANYGTAGIFGEAIRTPALMASAGETVVNVATSTYNLVATSGLDVLCVQVTWPDGGAPPSLTTGDNAYNGATAGAYATTLNFVFDGQ